jgi:hypothetical protein
MEGKLSRLVKIGLHESPTFETNGMRLATTISYGLWLEHCPNAFEHVSRLRLCIRSQKRPLIPQPAPGYQLPVVE